MNNNSMQDTAALVGRIALALIFIVSGFSKIAGFAGTAGFMAKAGLPMPEVLLALTILIELGGGLLIAVGYNARWAALAIAAFIVPVTLVFHNPVGADQTNMIMFMKNISIIGGMLFVYAFGPGAFSIDERRAA